MKYTIFGFSQKIACDYKLDLYDLAILRWIVDFYPRMSKITINDDVYVWVNYEQLRVDMPIMNIKKDAIYRRLKNMCKNDILKHYTVRKGGTYSYYALGKKYLSLIDEGFGFKTEGYDSKTEGYDFKTERGMVLKPEQNNSSTSNSSTKQCVKEEKEHTQEALTQEEYNVLISKYDNYLDIVNAKVERAKKYKGCNNLATIESWIVEEIERNKDTANNIRTKSAPINRFNDFEQRNYTKEELDELEKRLLAR